MIPTIRDVRTIATAPAGINLLAVKIETSEPGLYGLGCATFAYRAATVQHLIDTYIKPLLIGRPVDTITEIWQLLHQNAYWRSGPIENNAISGVDEALWDIKGKMADMPLYELFGGKVRPAVPVFLDARGRDFEEMCAEFDRVRAAGCGAVRCACDSSFYSGMAIPVGTPEGALPGNYIDQRQIINGTLNMFEKLRVKYGEEVELMYDTHERIHPTQAREFCHRADQYHLYFLEDVVSPENLDWLPDIRSHCTTPLAHGELDVNVHDWRRPIIGRSIDFIRPHISDIGGLTGARRVAMFAEQYDVRTCWHCPGDITPIGSACNIHLDLATPNCGIQEWTGAFIADALRQGAGGGFDCVREVFSGIPEYRDGYVYVSDKPGHGVDIDEKAAAKYPYSYGETAWTQCRTLDGALHTP